MSNKGRSDIVAVLVVCERAAGDLQDGALFLSRVATPFGFPAATFPLTFTPTVVVIASRLTDATPSLETRLECLAPDGTAAMDPIPLPIKFKAGPLLHVALALRPNIRAAADGIYTLRLFVEDAPLATAPIAVMRLVSLPAPGTALH